MKCRCWKIKNPSYLRYCVSCLNVYYDGINPFQSNFSATRILPSYYIFWAGKRVGYL
jgi:hypothetical protein